jgi:hypothetical protein
MPRTRTTIEALAGHLILAIQREWHAEAGEAIAAESEDVMGRAHALLQAAKTNDLATALGKRSVEEYLGSAWLSTHPAVVPAARAFATGVAQAWLLKEQRNER